MAWNGINARVERREKRMFLSGLFMKRRTDVEVVCF
jgi:hypothetical protein